MTSSQSRICVPSRTLERESAAHTRRQTPVAAEVTDEPAASAGDGRREDDDLSRLFPAEEWDDYELGIVHGAVLAAVYHVIRADADREAIFDTLEEIVANDVIREYADNSC